MARRRLDRKGALACMHACMFETPMHVHVVDANACACECFTYLYTSLRPS